ncbi:MAG: molybdopterin-dependent oxidoreductase [Deltaproteobacteria bacterium]|nr:molybdopterin-dependent oxidoreductase [Deltaproteobacteria bacterium]
MKTSRREFLKGAATGAASTAFIGCQTRKSSEGLDGSMTWKKAPCRFCGTGCGTLVGVKNGRIEAVTGDPDCPVNRGTLCAKGYHLPSILYGKDRITHPQLRKGDKYVQISWDEAIDIVAKKYKEAIAKHGPKSVAIYGSGQWTIQEGYAAQKWFKGGMQSNNIDPNARLCMASAVVGLITTFGSDEPMGAYDDLEYADTFVLWGNNMAEMHPVLFNRVLARKRKSPHVKLIDITTRRTPTSAYADKVLMMKPQGDLAIANGIARYLLFNDKIDRSFVDALCTFRKGKTQPGYGTEDHFKFKPKPEPITLDQYKELVAPYTPEKVEELAGIPTDDFIYLAEQFAKTSTRVMSLWCMGVNQHVRGSWMNNLIYAVHLLSGKIGVPGSTPFSLTGQPSACGTCREVGTLAHALPADGHVKNPKHRAKAEKIWKVKPGTISPKPGYHTMAMFRALDRGELKVMWVQVTNPFVTIPNLKRYRDGKKKKRDDSFLIVSDIYPTPTTALADLILPSAGWVEKEGVFGNSERRHQQWDRIVEPPGEAKPDVWQTAAVARKMGYTNLFPKTDSLEKDLYMEFREFTLGTGKDVPDYEILRRTNGGMRWPYVDGKETIYRYVPGHDPYAKGSGRMDFYKAKKTDHRAVIWFRPWEPAAESPDEQYPMWLCTGRVLEHWHSGSMTRRVPQLHRAIPKTYCEIHPDDAHKLGVFPGDKVRVTSRRGSVELVASINARAVPRPGLVFVPFFDESIAINDVTLDAFCHMSKEPDYKKCAVKVEKIS